MNYSLVFDIINDPSLGKELHLEILKLLNWCSLQSKPNLSIFSLSHDSFKVRSNQSYLQNWNPSFASEGQTLRLVPRTCFNAISHSKIFYISNNTPRWSSEISSKCKPFFLNSAPCGYFTETSASEVFKQITEIVLPMQLNGLIVISNEGKYMIGKTFEVSVQVTPVLMPLHVFPEVSFEICVESVVSFDSIMVQHVFGEPWIVSSTVCDFFSICSYCRSENLVMICSSELDFDMAKASPLPIFYALFPAMENPTNFLMRKIACEERIRKIDLPPVINENRPTEIVKFLNENFEVCEFSPKAIESGIHQFFNAMIEKEGSKVSASVFSGSGKKIGSSLDNVVNSMLKKKVKKTFCKKDL